MTLTKIIWQAFTLSVLTLVNVIAQDQEETLFSKNDGENEMSFVFSPGLNISPMVESTAAIVHLRTGLSINKKWTFGGYYQASLNDLEPQGELNNIYMDYRSAGAFVEYTLQPGKLVHLTFPLQVGLAEIEMDNESDSAGFGEENFLVIEPGAQLEINLHKNLKLSAGVAYRFTGDFDYRNVATQDIQGLVGTLGFKFVFP